MVGSVCAPTSAPSCDADSISLGDRQAQRPAGTFIDHVPAGGRPCLGKLCKPVDAYGVTRLVEIARFDERAGQRCEKRAACRILSGLFNRSGLGPEPRQVKRHRIDRAVRHANDCPGAVGHTVRRANPKARKDRCDSKYEAMQFGWKPIVASSVRWPSAAPRSPFPPTAARDRRRDLDREECAGPDISLFSRRASQRAIGVSRDLSIGRALSRPPASDEEDGRWPCGREANADPAEHRIGPTKHCGSNDETCVGRAL